jgi:hypothetical protein
MNDALHLYAGLGASAVLVTLTIAAIGFAVRKHPIVAFLCVFGVAVIGAVSLIALHP